MSAGIGDQAVLEGGRDVLDEMLDARHRVGELPRGGEKSVGVRQSILVLLEILRLATDDVEAAEIDYACEIVLRTAGQLLDDRQGVGKHLDGVRPALVAAFLEIVDREVEHVDLAVPTERNLVSVEHAQNVREGRGNLGRQSVLDVAERELVEDAEDRLEHLGKLIDQGVNIDADILELDCG